MGFFDNFFSSKESKIASGLKFLNPLGKTSSMGFFDNFFSSKESKIASGLTILNPLGKTSSKYLADQDRGKYSDMLDAYITQMQDVLSRVQDEYAGYVSNTEDLLGNSPKIDLSPYMNQLGSYSKDILSEAEKSSVLMKTLANRTTRGVNEYMSSADSMSDSMLDNYLNYSRQADVSADKGLDTALDSYGSYLDQYKSMARSDMPGMSLYKGQIGAQTASDIQQLKNMGGLSSSNMVSMMNNRQNQLRDLSLQSMNYKANRQQALADATANYGNMSQSAYSTNIANKATAANLAGTGYNQAIQNKMANAGLTLNLGQYNTDVYNQSYSNMSNALNSASGMTQAQAGLADTQYQYNNLNPYNNALNWNMSQAQANNANQMAMQLYGDLAGLSYSGLQGANNMFMGATTSGDQTSAGIMGILGKLFMK